MSLQVGALQCYTVLRNFHRSFFWPAIVIYIKILTLSIINSISLAQSWNGSILLSDGQSSWSAPSTPQTRKQMPQYTLLLVAVSRLRLKIIGQLCTCVYIVRVIVHLIYFTSQTNADNLRFQAKIQKYYGYKRGQRTPKKRVRKIQGGLKRFEPELL